MGIVFAVATQRRRRTPLDSLGIKIEQASEIPRVIEGNTAGPKHLTVAVAWERAGSVTGRGAPSPSWPSKSKTLNWATSDRTGRRQRIRKQVRAKTMSRTMQNIEGGVKEPTEVLIKNSRCRDARPQGADGSAVQTWT